MNCAQNVRLATASGNQRCTAETGCELPTAHGLAALVVDDDPIMLKLAAAMLRAFGYMVRTAGGSAQALLDLRGAACDIVLTDYVMPAMDGYQLSCRIKSRYPETRVVIMTGANRIEVTGMMDDGGIDGWLFKPFNPADLKFLLEQLRLPVRGS
jgi:CheY-like chemotaxis protein